MIGLQATSMTRAPLGTVTLPVAPTAVTRSPVTTTSPLGMTSSPFIVMIRAPRSTTVPARLPIIPCGSARDRPAIGEPTATSSCPL